MALEHILDSHPIVALRLRTMHPYAVFLNVLLIKNLSGSGRNRQLCACVFHLRFPFVPTVRPRNATRGGVNGSLRKLSQSKALAQDPKAHSNPKVLGEVQSSYQGAALTQNKPRNKREQARKHTQENGARRNARYIHRLNRRAQGKCVGLTGVQSLQQ